MSKVHIWQPINNVWYIILPFSFFSSPGKFFTILSVFSLLTSNKPFGGFFFFSELVLVVSRSEERNPISLQAIAVLAVHCFSFWNWHEGSPSNTSSPFWQNWQINYISKMQLGSFLSACGLSEVKTESSFHIRGIPSLHLWSRWLLWYFTKRSQDLKWHGSLN